MSDLEIIMAYTGWSAETTQNAIRTWRKWRPDWNARYLLPFVRRHLLVAADRGALAAANVTPSAEEVSLPAAAAEHSR